MIPRRFKKFVELKLSRQLIGLILSVYFGVALTLTVVQLFSEFRNEKSNLTAQIAGMADTFKPTITEALWNYEDDQDPVCVRSRTGYVMSLGGAPIHWVSKLQTEIALSTTEAEYIVLSQALRELVPLR